MNVWEIVVNRLLAQLDKGIVPWHQTWESSVPMNLVSKKPYRGLNQLLLSGAPTPYFVTYKQCKAMYHNVKKGAEAYIVTFWKQLVYEDKDTGKLKKSLMFRYYKVFNVADTDIVIEQDTAPKPPIISCDAIIDGYIDCPNVQSSDHCAYSPTLDMILMPERNSFKSSESYYAALFHEAIHSTGHSSRLARSSIVDSTYHSDNHIRSEEELVAEIGSCYLRAAAGIDSNFDNENSVAYCQSWLRAIKNDQRILQRSIMAANKAAKYILKEDANNDSDNTINEG